MGKSTFTKVPPVGSAPNARVPLIMARAMRMMRSQDLAFLPGSRASRRLILEGKSETRRNVGKGDSRAPRFAMKDGRCCSPWAMR